MTVLPTAAEADRAEQETFVFDSDRDLGLNVTAVHADESEHGIDTADLADRIDQAWSVPYADDDDDLSCLAY
ncbi:hypothetical protein [Nocardia rhizosphaerihabitans]|uniref:Uncharacterized protein n=1 Tax=Nocardia rhizosphaerihabitans TaxID=1691570 RepID=A0ABQ2L1T7_9NOCA|nr:hypothetical protein [Nocardia rhizosphaerihabitans]GGN98256.1 hypothetical protein GCM10011610_65040 [Nocardia rhizosphaerihabitans]